MACDERSMCVEDCRLLGVRRALLRAPRIRHQCTRHQAPSTSAPGKLQRTESLDLRPQASLRHQAAHSS